jgi:hypothetical protein
MQGRSKRSPRSNHAEERIVRAALDSTAGFTLVLAAMKAFLEHGVPQLRRKG